MKIDPHIHSIYSGDSDSQIKDILKQGEKIGLDAIAISDHNTIKGSKVAIEKSKDMNIVVVPSIEISTIYGHMLGFGATEDIPRDLSAIETIEKIHDAGGLAIVPHPYSYYRHGLFTKIDDKLPIDGVEVKNARYILGYSNNKGKQLSQKYNIPEFGASDSHFVASIGDCYTEIDCEANVDDILDAIVKNKTKAVGGHTSNFKIFGNIIRRRRQKEKPIPDEEKIKS